jgi:hypothetical protein
MKNIEEIGVLIFLACERHIFTFSWFLFLVGHGSRFEEIGFFVFSALRTINAHES